MSGRCQSCPVAIPGNVSDRWTSVRRKCSAEGDLSATHTPRCRAALFYKISCLRPAVPGERADSAEREPIHFEVAAAGFLDSRFQP